MLVAPTTPLREVAGVEERIAPAGEAVAPPEDLRHQDAGIDPAGEEHPHVAVQREDEVVGAQRVAGADHDRLLADAGVDPAHYLVLPVQGGDTFVEAPDEAGA